MDDPTLGFLGTESQWIAALCAEVKRLRLEVERLKRGNAELLEAMAGNPPASLRFVLDVEAAKIVDPLLKELEQLRLAVRACVCGLQPVSDPSGKTENWHVYLEREGKVIVGATPAEALAAAARERNLTT